MTIPKLIIPEGIWNQLVEEAKTSDGTLKAFGLFSERRTASRRNYIVKDFMRINVEIVKENSASGPIFRFRNMKDKGFYLSGKRSPRYCGTAMIQKNLDMTLRALYSFLLKRFHGF